MLTQALRTVMEDYAWDNFDKDVLPDSKQTFKLFNDDDFEMYYVKCFPKADEHKVIG